jgi:transposase
VSSREKGRGIRAQERNKLTRKAFRDAIVEGVGYGMSVRAASIAAEVPYRTTARWMAYGREQHEADPDAPKSKWSPQRKFFEAIQTAEQQLQKKLLMRMHVHQAKTMKATAFLLERKFSTEWGRRETLKVESDVNNPVEITLSKDLEKAIDALVNGGDRSDDEEPSL